MEKVANRNIKFGDVIKGARSKIGLSQKDLAAQIVKRDFTKVTVQYIHNIEHNRCKPSDEYLVKQFAKALDLSSNYLLYILGIWPESFANLNEKDFEEALRAFKNQLDQ